MTILVTGGAGYIGSHTLIELIKADHNVVVIDNLCNSSKTAIDRVERIIGTSIKVISVIKMHSIPSLTSIALMLASTSQD